MRILEIVSAVVAEKLMDNGTQFVIDPDQVIWPDGKITKVNTPQKKGRGRAKKTPPTSKNGVFGKIVQNFGSKNSNATASASVLTNEVEVIVPSAEKEKSAGAESMQSEGNPVPKRRGISVPDLLSQRYF